MRSNRHSRSAHLRRRLLAFIAIVVAALAVLVVVTDSASDKPVTRVRALTTGVITNIGSNYFTVRTAGSRAGMLNRMTAAATRIQRQDWPYVWGGGHAHAGVADIGVPGHGNSQTSKGFDCSGAVGDLLVAVGLYPAGESLPNDAGIVDYLLERHLIAPGPGRGPASVTFYDQLDTHIFMNIGGRLWGTGSGGPAGDSNGGAGWLDGSSEAASSSFKKYHLRAAVLDLKPGAGYSITYAYGSAGSGELTGLKRGDPVNVTARAVGDGTMVAASIAKGRVYLRHGQRYIKQQRLARTPQHMARV
jgi:hypothetical protein